MAIISAVAVCESLFVTLVIFRGLTCAGFSVCGDHVYII